MRIRKITLLTGILLFNSSLIHAEEHRTFTALLSNHVNQGRVNYPGLCQDERLTKYITQLAQTIPEKLPARESQLAFWINTYNAHTLKLICDHYPLKSINEIHKGGLIIGAALGQTAWDRKFVYINGKLLSLGQIEHKILRPVFKDARIHFAIVCAAKGCPPLRSEAYEAKRINDQLNDQGKIFISDYRKNFFDTQKKVASVSPIFSWFKKDFGSKTAKVIEFLLPFLTAETAQVIKMDIKNWRILYTQYDWSLNE